MTNSKVATDSPRVKADFVEAKAPDDVHGSNNDQEEQDKQQLKFPFADRPMLKMPSNGEQLLKCTVFIFKRLAKIGRYFNRESTIWEAAKAMDGALSLKRLDAGHFVSRICTHFSPVNHFFDKEKKKFVDIPTIPTKQQTEIFMKSNDVTTLPTIQLILNAPIITLEGKELRILEKGYHPIRGGIQIISHIKIDQDITWKQAVRSLKGLLRDFKPATEADRGRILAALMAPAFHFGKVLDSDVPLFLIEADLSQTGKSYLAQCICAIYC
jgi:hypothetical protein